MPTWFIGLFSSKWTWIAIGMMAATTAVTLWVQDFGNKRYEEGRVKERAVWQEAVTEAQTRALNARNELNRLTLEHAAEAQRLRNERNRALAQVREDIQNATDLDTQYSIYVGHSSGLRNEAAANLARARADYLSSIPADAGGSAPAVGPGGLAANDAGGSYGSAAMGFLVGECLGQR